MEEPIQLSDERRKQLQDILEEVVAEVGIEELEEQFEICAEAQGITEAEIDAFLLEKERVFFSDPLLGKALHDLALSPGEQREFEEDMSNAIKSSPEEDRKIRIAHCLHQLRTGSLRGLSWWRRVLIRVDDFLWNTPVFWRIRYLFASRKRREEERQFRRAADDDVSDDT